MKNTVQLNTRVRPEYRGAVRFAAGVIGKSADETSEILIRVFVGQEDNEVRQLRDRVVRAWKAVGDKLPL